MSKQLMIKRWSYKNHCVVDIPATIKVDDTVFALVQYESEVGCKYYSIIHKESGLTVDNLASIFFPELLREWKAVFNLLVWFDKQYPIEDCHSHRQAIVDWFRAIRLTRDEGNVCKFPKPGIWDSKPCYFFEYEGVL